MTCRIASLTSRRRHPSGRGSFGVSLSALFLSISILTFAEVARAADAAVDPGVVVPTADGKVWLTRMNDAFATLEYDGVFSYFGGADLATLRVVHLIVDGVQRERLVHLNGAPREIIRTGDDVACIMQPGDKILELESSIPAGPFARGFTRRFDAVDEYYTVTAHGNDRIAGRSAVRLAVTPRDEHRFGYRLWIDVGSSLLLRSEMRDAKGDMLEVFQFVSLQLGPGIPRSALQPETRDGSITSHLTLRSGAAATEPGGTQWRTSWVPNGFMMASADVRRTPNALKAINTMMYTDGLAAFSIFVESMPQPGAGGIMSRSGATVAVTELAAGNGASPHLVTVVGEVPTATARRIARAVYFR